MVCCAFQPRGRDKGYICIEIQDTGKGIDEALQHKIFEPYFSTKEGVSNLGMGLSSSTRWSRSTGASSR